MAQPVDRARHAGLLRWLVTRPNLAAFLLYAVLATLFFLPGLIPGHTTSGSDFLWSAAPWTAATPRGVPLRSLHPLVYGSNPVLIDPATVFQPFLQYTRSQLPHIPLWDPYIMGGMPYLADMQSAVFSVFSLPAYVLPFWWSLSLIAVLKLLVAAMGAFLLGRSLKMRFSAAFLCGAIFGFGLFLVTWVPWPLANVFPFIPWLLVATDHLIRRPGALSVAGLGAIVGLQFFGGHPESSFDALFATVAFFVLRVLREPGAVLASVTLAARQGRSRVRAVVRSAGRPVMAFVLALALGTALAAITILPFLELLHHSSDLASRPRQAVYVPPKYFFSVFLPNYFPGVFKELTGFYVGALPLTLAVVAVARPRAERIAVAVFSAVCVFVVLGVQPFFGIVSHLPGFDSTYNTRLTILYLLGMALLGGWGLDDLSHGTSGARRPLAVTGLATALLLFPVVVVLAARAVSAASLGRAFEIAWGLLPSPNVSQPHAVPVIRLASLIVWVVFAGLAAGLLYARARRGVGARSFAALAVILVLGDLFRAGMGFNPAIPDSHAEQPVTPAIRYLQRQRPARFVAVAPSRGVNPLPPDVNLRYGLYDARGYDFPVVARFGRMWSRYEAPPNPLLPLNTPEVSLLSLEAGPGALQVLSLLGVRDILQEPRQPPLRLPGLTPVYEGSDATIYANHHALPRAWLVAGQRVAENDQQALTAIGNPGLDLRRIVVTEHPLPGLARVSSSAAAAGTARIASYSAEKVAIEISATRPAELVLSDTWFPGWKAAVDGRPAPINRVDYLLRGVPVPPGTHRIVFTYDPVSFEVGWQVSLGATLVLAAALAVAYSRRLRARRSRPRHAAARVEHRGAATSPERATQVPLHVPMRE